MCDSIMRQSHCLCLSCSCSIFMVAESRSKIRLGPTTASSPCEEQEGDRTVTKSKLNLLIDVLAYLGMMSMLSTGLMLMYIMPPGTGGCHGEGGARITLLGLSRHEWGKVHWYVAVGLIVVAAVHVLLHWKWVTNTLANLTRPSVSRKAAGAGPLLVLGIVGAAAIAAPWIIGTETHPTGGDHAEHRPVSVNAPKSCADCTVACPFSGLAEVKEKATPEVCKDPNCTECDQAEPK